jgi:hypothetical protein
MAETARRSHLNGTMARSFDASHVTRSGSFRLPASPHAVFPFFSPEGERAWAPGWEPEYLHPRHGSPVRGLVFRTAAGGEHTVWVLLRYDRGACEAEYVRVVPGSRIGTVEVRCQPAPGHETDVSVTYRLTALTDEGNETLSRFSEETFARMLEEWRAALTRVLGTGQRGEDP